MASTITFIDDLKHEDDAYTLKVRIIRLWKLNSFKNPKELWSIEMILMDEKGSKIHAVVIQKWLSKFNRLLEEGSVVQLSRFHVDNNDCKYKYTVHKYKLSFYYNTRVVKCTDFNGSLYGISLVSYDAILNNSVRRDVLLDVIGVVDNNCKTLKSSDGDENKIRMVMRIKDLSGDTIKVILWEPYVSQMEKYALTTQQNGPVIILLQFAKCNEWEGPNAISNSFNATRLFINSDINEINSFRESLLVNPSIHTASTSLTIGSSTSYSLHNDFVANNEFKNISEVMEIKEKKSCIIM